MYLIGSVIVIATPWSIITNHSQFGFGCIVMTLDCDYDITLFVGSFLMLYFSVGYVE